MRRIIHKTLIMYILLAVTLIEGCKKEDGGFGKLIIPAPKVIPQATDVNKFIWTGLHDFYLWNDMIPNLTTNKFNNKDSLNQFLNKSTDPQQLFASLLYKYEVVDRWSFLVEDAKTIDDWISGTSKTMGYDFRLAQIGNTNNVFGFVRYVLKDSPADKAGMKRGDIFISVNNEQLTISNYAKLLFSNDTYKLGFAKFTVSGITATDRSLTMTAVTMQENPIYLDTIFTSQNEKIGYLVYNGFNSEFDIQLNDVMKKFKEANINQMVLDLRYNGGGSVQSSIYLASMIYGTHKTKLFARAQYNANLQEYFADMLDENFALRIAKTETTPETPITTLNLQKVYIIVSGNTASASELLINGLRPYMNVKVVGINTYGKYVGSATIRDWDEQGNVNPSHNYAMQPIIVKYVNSAGDPDFVNGLTPNIFSEEDYVNLLPFGDPNEQLLSAVLNDINGIQVTSKTLKSAQFGLKKLADSHDFKPFAYDMYMNPQNLKRQKN
jgi:carboxyl-terminal processing protease